MSDTRMALSSFYCNGLPTAMDSPNREIGDFGTGPAPHFPAVAHIDDVSFKG